MQPETAENEPNEISPFDKLEIEIKKKPPRVRKTLVSVMENKLTDIDKISKQIADYGAETNIKIQKLIDDFDRFKVSCNEKLRYLYEELKDQKK